MFLYFPNEKNHIHFSVLDSLRGLAALAVAVFHLFDDGKRFFAGYLAVDFFLVLSGFILSHTYLYQGKIFTKTDFISHRIARLYPLHIYTLITFILVSLPNFPAYPDGIFFTLLQQITLTHNIGLNPHSITWNGPSWSVSVEFWVNIIFIFFITKQVKSITLFIFSLLGILLIYFNTGHLDVQYTNYYGFINSGMIRGLSSFLLGILSYRAYLHYK